jgi:hypothetical protein
MLESKKPTHGYAEYPSELGIFRALDTRLRGYDGRAARLCHTREGGYPESITQLGLSAEPETDS